MQPIELLAWRKRYRVRQEDLAKHLGVHRNTLSNWETGRTAIPAGLDMRLPLKVEGSKAVYEYVTRHMAHTRRDLALFGDIARGDGGRAYPQAGPEHPRRLLPHLGNGKIPVAVLDSEEYLAALEAYRAGKPPITNS